MTKLIRNPVTHQFLASGFQWTPDTEKAEAITDYLEAAALVKLLGLKQAELYYCFGDAFHSSRWDFSIPVESSFADPIR